MYGKDLEYVKCTAVGPTLCNNNNVVYSYLWDFPAH